MFAFYLDLMFNLRPIMLLADAMGVVYIKL